MSLVLLLPLLLSLPAPAAQGEAALRVLAPERAVTFGAPFELVVEREWDEGLVPEPFDETALPPLALVLEEREERRAAGRVVETLRYRAQAFAPGEVRVPAAELRALPVGGGEPVTARSEELALEVRSSLPPDDAGRPEPPPGPLPEPARKAPLLGLLAAGAALLALAAWSWRRWTRRPGERAAATPAERALAALEQLDPRAPAPCAFAAGAALREYVAARYALPTTARTSEELLALPETARALGDERRALLAELLARIDRARFSGRAPDEAGARALVDGVRRFVTDDASPREVAA
jgi:hypothetical protein